MTRTRDVLILRHGQTAWNSARRMQGARDSELTSRGIEDATAQRDILDNLDLTEFAWFCSPQGRARQTAQLARPNQTFVEDSRLSEIDLGLWNGRAKTELVEEAPHLFDSDDSLTWYDHAPQGEGLQGLERRVQSFLAQAPEKMVIVTHGITSRVLRCCLLGMPTEAFAELTGGQGIIYRVTDAFYQKLTLQGTVDLR